MKYQDWEKSMLQDDPEFNQVDHALRYKWYLEERKNNHVSIKMTENKKGDIK